MSGILVVWKLDDAPVLKSELNAMAKAMERRGPEGLSVWKNGSVGLGHALLATTPEASKERIPFNHPESDLTITADARLDNREVLLDQLYLTDRRSSIGDGELILHAYVKWGSDCVLHLLGDFAFSIWDERKKKLFCARDQVGMKQLLYTYSERKIFALATDHEALLTLSEVPRHINQARILDCLTDHLESVDKTSTMFSNILRLPPGHTLQVNNGGIKVLPYWKMEPPAELHLACDEDYQRAFRDVFDEAVRARLRGGDNVGSMLSGGLDSSSIVASACEIRKTQSYGPLQTISCIDGSGVQSKPETEAIEAMSKLDGLQPSFIELKEMDQLAPTILRNLPDMKEPFDGSMNMIRAVYHTAKSNGLKVVLDGVGGDAAMDIGNYGKRLIRKGNLFKAFQEMKADHQFWGLDVSDSEEYLRMLVSAFLPKALRDARGTLATRKLEKDLIAELGIKKSFAEEYRLFNRLMEFRSYGSLSTWKDPQHHAVRVFEHPNEVVARERYDRVAAEYGIETRDPYRDIRVMKFCASLPSSQKSKNGWPKYILRQAFASSFPKETMRRMGKEDLGWAFTQTVLGHAKRISEVERKELKATLVPYSSKPKGVDLFSEDWFYLANWISGQNSKT